MKVSTMKKANSKRSTRLGALTLGLALSLGSTAAIAQSASPATPSTERMDDTNAYGGNRTATGTTVSPSRPVSGTAGKTMQWDKRDTKPRSERLDNSSVYNSTPAGEGAGNRVNDSAR